MDAFWNGSLATNIDLARLTANLILSLVLATVLAWYYARFGRALSNRARFAQTLPLLAVTTAFVFTMVRSSAALALGLVGALSIIRFRTAIKEPEELLYLFVAIAIGLGVGAEQQAATVVALVVVLAYLSLREYTAPRQLAGNVYVDIVSPEGDSTFAEISELLRRHSPSANLRRIDRRDATIQATYLIPSSDDGLLIALMDELRDQIPECEFSFVEQDNTLGG